MKMDDKIKMQIKKYVADHNALIRNPEFKVDEPTIRGYMELEKQSVQDLDQKRIIDWIQGGGPQSLRGRHRRNFEFFNYKIEISFHKKLDELPGSAWQFLCSIQSENVAVDEYVYYKVNRDHKTFFNDRILFDDFFNNLDFHKCKDKRSKFFRIQPFVEKYGYFIGSPNNHWIATDFTEWFALEHHLLKHFFAAKQKYGEKVFAKNLKEPSMKGEEKYWEWFESFGRYFQDIPGDRFLEYSTFKPVDNLVLRTRGDRQAKFIYDFFPQPVNFLYKLLFKGDFSNWRTCGYCDALFKKRQKNQTCCSSHHAKLARNKKYKRK